MQEDDQNDELAATAAADAFSERTDRVVANVRDVGGFPGTDVSVVFRKQKGGAGGKDRCFFCLLTGGKLSCVEINCTTGKPLPTA